MYIDEAYDQVLEEVMVGPLVVGTNSFVLQSGKVDHSRIPNNDILGVTVVLVTCSYLEKEFVRIGYYVRNEYSEEYDPENPPNPVDIEKVSRNILDDQPRVTYVSIDWGIGGQQDLYPPEEVPPIDGKEEAEDLQDAVSEGEMNGEEGEGEEDDEEESEEEDSTGDMEIDINEDSMEVESMQTGTMANQ
jgi:histone chaperone ASF1